MVPPFLDCFLDKTNTQLGRAVQLFGIWAILGRMDMTFAELGLNEQILAGVEDLGFTTPTPVQAQAIPEVLRGRDIVASAQTGTGKTAAFALPTLQLIAGSEPETVGKKHVPAPHALVVTPTRELAQQIEKVVSVVCGRTGQHAVIVMGGTKFDRQIKDLQAGCDLLVATPGRLLDLMEHNNVSLARVQIMVLDEADRMLDMGFWPSVRKILAALPERRQTLLFSATIPPSIKSTVDAMLHDPAVVEIARIGETAETVEEHLCPVTQGQKTSLLEALLTSLAPERALVFCRTKRRVDDVCKTLRRANFKVEEMHADRPQKAREKALERFRAAKVQVLVATDVMSRGIDVSGIDAVINYDVPMDPEDYVHRIGRTGRAGHDGQAFTFVAPDEISQLREVEYFTKKLVPVWDLEGFDYDASRIVPNPDRSTSKPVRTMFRGSRAGGRGPAGGRFGRHM